MYDLDLSIQRNYFKCAFKSRHFHHADSLVIKNNVLNDTSINKLKEYSKKVMFLILSYVIFIIYITVSIIKFYADMYGILYKCCVFHILWAI